jgi:hypothetical protein
MEFQCQAKPLLFLLTCAKHDFPKALGAGELREAQPCPGKTAWGSTRLPQAWAPVSTPCQLGPPKLSQKLLS